MKKKPLDHLLVVRGGLMHEWRGRGANGATLQLHQGVPEPITNCAEGFADALLEDGVCVLCTEDGRTEDGKLHPTMKDRIIQTGPVFAAEETADTETEESVAPAPPVTAGGILAEPGRIPVVGERGPELFVPSPEGAKEG